VELREPPDAALPLENGREPAVHGIVDAAGAECEAGIRHHPRDIARDRAASLRERDRGRLGLGEIPRHGRPDLIRVRGHLVGAHAEAAGLRDEQRDEAVEVAPPVQRCVGVDRPVHVRAFWIHATDSAVVAINLPKLRRAGERTVQFLPRRHGSMYDLVVRHGLAVLPDGVRRADIAVLDGRIAAVGPVTGTAGRVVDASGLWILPGGVEPHMHVENDFLGLSTANDFFTQSVAAAFGGVTTAFDFANAERGGSLIEAIDRRKDQMAKSAIDFAVHGRVLEPAHIEELPAAVRAGCPSFKVYMTYPEVGLMADDATLLAAFRAARSARALPLVHAESDPIVAALTGEARREGDLSWSRYPDTRPPLCEAEAFARATRFARLAGCPLYVVHTSVAEAVAEARLARKAGLRLYVETCPQYLLLTRDLYDDPERGHLAICAPPLRDGRDRPTLWQALADGTIDCVGSDDCAYTAAAKAHLLERGPDGRPIQDFTRVVQGIPGIETRLPLLLSEGVARGRLTLERVAVLTSEAPARCLGCYPQKGAIRVGSDADLVLVDPEIERVLSSSTLHGGADYCLYEGRRVRGWPVMTIARGRVIVGDGDFCGERGAGRFVAREPTR
jgi:dihydropyrimidinase